MEGVRASRRRRRRCRCRCCSSGPGGICNLPLVPPAGSMDEPGSLGGTPLRTALRADREGSGTVPRKRARGADSAGNLRGMSKNTYVCLWCGDRVRYDRTDRPSAPKSVSIDQLAVNDKCKEFLGARFGERGTHFCPSCKPIACSFVDSCGLVDSPSKCGILRTLEAFIDRDDGSGQAVDTDGCHHQGVYQRRTCRVLFNQDKTSRRLEQELAPLLDDKAAAHMIGRTFSDASFSTKRGDEAAQNSSWEEPEEEGDTRPVEPGQWFNFFGGFPNVGPFKSLFCLYWLSTTARSETTRLECKHSLETHILADWGTGRALAEIAADRDPEGLLRASLPLKQKDSSAHTIRRCTILLIILYFSAFGDAMMRILLPHARSHRVWNFSLLHLEFVLCELRKASCIGRFKLYTNKALQFPAEKVCLPSWT